jgi:hypothetical protein
VKLRKRYLPIAAVLGAGLAIVPALAAVPPEATLEVNENCVEADWPCWATPGSGSYPSPASTVRIAPGGKVKFKDDASTAATVTWTGSAPACSGITASAATGWEGTCEFTQPGTYRFESPTLFNEGGSLDYTKYEIVVENTATGTTGTTTTTTTTPTTTTTTTTTTPTTTTPTATTPTTTTPTTTTPTATTSTQPYGGAGAVTGKTGAIEGPSAPAVGHPVATLASAQHGDDVRGTVQVPAADSGARLEVEVLAAGASLARVRRHVSSRVGRLVRASAPAGTVSFNVPLDAAARRALRRHHKLALTVKIVLTPAHGSPLTLTRSLDLR